MTELPTRTAPLAPPAGPSPTPLADVPAQFPAADGYLDTASLGLPPAATVRALHAGVEEWAAGTASAPGYDAAVTTARASFARLAGTDVEDVAVGSQASVLVGVVAAALPDGAEVVAPEEDFTSVLFPFLAQEREGGRGIRVRLVPLAELAAAIGPGTALVALSSVQSQDGRIADLAGVRAAAARHGARILLDVTQSAGWLPLRARDYDYVVCSAYKWLLCPRGVAFFAVRPDRVGDLLPVAAGWYAGQDRWSAIYGGPLRLAETARRLDVSPAWLAWAGAVPSLALLECVGVAAVHAHNVALADRLRAGLGLPAAGSAIVSLRAADLPVPDPAPRLGRAGLRASVRGDGVRVAFHLYSTARDVDRVLDALHG